MRALIVIGTFLLALQAVYADSVTFNNDCTFTVHTPGLFGGMDQDHFIKKGAIFTENNDHQYCGQTSVPTPFGPAISTECVGINGKTITSFSEGITSLNETKGSTCEIGAELNQLTYTEAEFTPWDGKGPATLHGQAFLKTVGGDVKTCAGEDVFLLPANSYTDGLMRLKQTSAENVDPRFKSHIRHTICNAQGNFTFSNVPAKPWIITTQVTWGVPHISDPDTHTGLIAGLIFGQAPEKNTDMQGGMLLQTITLSDGDNQTILSDRDAQ